MGTGNGRKAGWIFCILGWILAAAVFAFLPKQIPIRFTDGVPSAVAGRETVFLWPLIQMIVLLLGRKRSMLPDALGRLLSDSQYEWAVCGLSVFVFALEALMIFASFAG
ncbi:MAG TPA: DUF1648 domain-containing protein [Candidatus Mediterraneibacter intestinigallinarum]|nr:DUF1648 domain-containing protein [Candidatus Mediterraneibacter intestinigallinarum]